MTRGRPRCRPDGAPRRRRRLGAGQDSLSDDTATTLTPGRAACAPSRRSAACRRVDQILCGMPFEPPRAAITASVRPEFAPLISVPRAVRARSRILRPYSCGPARSPGMKEASGACLRSTAPISSKSISPSPTCRPSPSRPLASPKCRCAGMRAELRQSVLRSRSRNDWRRAWCGRYRRTSADHALAQNAADSSGKMKMFWWR